MDCYKRGLKKSVDYLKKSEILKDDVAVKEFFKIFSNKRGYFFKQSRKTKNEYPTSYIFQEVLENLDEDVYNELASLYHSCEAEEWKPFEYTKDTLEKISYLDDVKMAVLSNHPNHAMVKDLLKKYDLYQYFDVVVTSAKFKKRKPDPEIFHHTLEKMGLENDAENCIICGDEYADIMGGYRAGLQTILCKRTYEFPFEREIDVPNLITIENISEILEYIS
jgi:HAD superfamily hydrolase (TIGR01549 family)